MSYSKLVLIAVVACGASTLAMFPSHAAFNYNDKDRQARWTELHTLLFGARALHEDDKALQLVAPDTALDAAVVPITLTLADPKNVKSFTLVVDDNPSPVAARFAFGPDADPAKIELRVRVDHVTMMHAVAEMKDGSLVEASRLVKASGGCSAPMGVSDEEAMAGMGQMKLKLADDAADKTVEATLMIRHPNFSGMQMNEALQVFTPARYIKKIDVSFEGTQVFEATTDISLSSNPVISFLLQPSVNKGDLRVEVEDSKEGKWIKTFPLPNVAGN